MLDRIRKKIVHADVRAKTDSGKVSKKLIEQMIFKEENMSMAHVEQYIFPFEQSGYLTAEQKLHLLLYIAEKEETEGGKRELLSVLYDGSEEIGENKINRIYLNQRRRGRGFLSGEDKREFLAERLANQLGDGLVGILFRLEGDEVFIGDCCPCSEKYENEITERKIGVRKSGKIYRFPFLQFPSEEEMERIIRNQMIWEKKGEITIRNPVWDIERADGSSVHVVRPPASAHWGMKVTFGERKGEFHAEKNWICGGGK